MTDINPLDAAWQASEAFRVAVCGALGIPYEVEGMAVDGMETDALRRIRALVKTEEAYNILRNDHAAMEDRIDKAWHAVCGSGMAAPDALAHLLEILAGQHEGADPHMAAIDVLRARKIDE